jgi:hypothetical protein
VEDLVLSQRAAVSACLAMADLGRKALTEEQAQKRRPKVSALVRIVAAQEY